MAYPIHCRMRRFYDDQRGSILALFGISLLVLVAVGGAGFDLGRKQLVRMKLQQAADTAALAAAALPSGTSDSERKAEAQRYFEMNFPDGYLGTKRPAPSISTGSSIQVTANADTPTDFIDNVGISTLASTGSSAVSLPNISVDYDVVMVVDESGSTASSTNGISRMSQEKKAITKMLDVLFPEGVTNPNVRFGLIGYTQYISNKWGLTSNKEEAADAVSYLAPISMNYDHYGLEAGLNMVTGNTDASVKNGKVPCNILPVPGFPAAKYCEIQKNVAVPPPRTPRTDSAPISKQKNIVFITDGYIMVEPKGCSNGIFLDDPDPPSTKCPDYDKFLAQCDKVKAAGVTLFTISFVSKGEGDVEALEKCASVDPVTNKPRYFYAPNGKALEAVLNNISTTITKIRIYQ